VKKLCISLLACLVIIGCATYTLVWNPIQLPPSVSYDKVWPAVVQAVTEYFEIEMIDKESGYLRTAWKEEKSFWGNNKRRRCQIRVVSREPINIQIQIQKQEYEIYNYLTGEGSWVEKGNDKNWEEKLKSEILSRFALLMK